MLVMALFVVLFVGGAQRVHAQFMRLGPFDVDASTSLNFIYTTNVEGQRKSEAELEMEDFYLVYSLSLSMGGPTTPNSDMTLSTAFSLEKHFIRDDLDTSSDPFGNVSLTHNMELGRFQLPTSLSFVRRNTQDDDGTLRIYIPGQRTERIVQDTRSFNQGVIFRYKSVTLNGAYAFSQTRYPDEEFREGDQDTESWTHGARWSFLRWRQRDALSLFYTYSRRRTELVNRPDAAGSGDWQTDQSYGLGVNILIIQRPELTYSMARVKSDGEDWRVTHTFSLSDDWELSRVMRLTANARYTIDEQPREDDISFVYSAGLDHQIGPTLRHAVRVSREPVDTFGSTTDTDRTTVGYTVSKSDLFFANISFNGGVTWEQNKPMGEGAGPTEETTTYTAGLSHSTALSRRLSRNLSYNYRWSQSNLDDEPIYEHRVTLGFTFTF